MQETEYAGAGPATGGSDGAPESHSGDSGPRRPLGVGAGAFIVLCLATTLIHILVVFLHVAPANAVSQLYSGPINAWVYPFFEQNWRLFAPDPESVNRQISVRTSRTAPDGSVRVSGWFDLSAVDASAVEHHPFPSHTAQNTLRRAWSSYLEAFGGDDEPHSERAVMMQAYLRNIAAGRVAAHRRDSFDSIQLRVITLPVAAPEASGAIRPTAPIDTRYLPWWKVAPHGTD
ncbi:DUF5819 family protein [Streptomyces sp. NRRL F-2664]|uniref:DUF5819 family protein n=1 Tax=Streptomyces sp. NRRL F-2664 TaxID=1463842 RepID=UPI001F3775EA|nr:DUF5819 family protein [Streptomyces sp. NRRL F-2664]